jgi:hypothetical protein
MASEFQECRYCQKKFKLSSTLLHHQKTAKYCIEKQGKINDDFKCDFCHKTLTTHNRLLTHLQVCKKKMNNDISNEKDNEYRTRLEDKEKLYEEKIKEQTELIIKLKEREKQKDDYISKLEEALEKANQTIADIAMQPKTTTTNNSDNRVHHQNITNNFDINDIAKITRMLDKHLTADVLRQGQEGVAEMLKTHLLQTESGEPIYECTDVARQKFEFRNVDGNLETDPNATKLIRNLEQSGIWNKAHSTGKKLWETEDGSVNKDALQVFIPRVTEVMEIGKDSTKLRRRLASITARPRRSK